ncbi:DUF1877 family protein [Corynebacterium halotolerans]|uniref:DUF1877 family protein n=1 Tax=Corynebacterium halotolerans TaxID=225326 RepID=UPI003CF7B632
MIDQPLQEQIRGGGLSYEDIDRAPHAGEFDLDQCFQGLHWVLTEGLEAGEHDDSPASSLILGDEWYPEDESAAWHLVPAERLPSIHRELCAWDRDMMVDFAVMNHLEEQCLYAFDGGDPGELVRRDIWPFFTRLRERVGDAAEEGRALIMRLL